MFTGQGLTWVLTAVTLALLPRYLGRQHMGELGIGLSFSTLAATVAGLGMATLITREVARDRDHTGELLATAFWLNIILGAAGGVAAITIGAFLGYSSMTQVAIIVLAVTVPLDLLILFGFSALQGAEVMRHQAIIDTANKLFSLAMLGLVVAFDLGFVAYLAVSFLSATLCAIPSVRIMRRHLPFSFRMFSFRRAVWLVRESFPLGAVNVVVVVYLALDVLLLSKLAGESAVGIYTTPSRIWGTLLFVPTIITTVVFPRMSAVTATGTHSLRGIARTTLEVIVGVTLPIALLTAFAGRGLLVTLVGHEFSQSAPVLALMAIALVPTGVNMACHRILVAANRQRLWMWVMGGALILKVALNFAFIPLAARLFDNAALGAAAGLVLAESAIMCVGLALIPRGTVTSATIRLIARLAAAAAVAALAMLALGMRGPVVAGVGGAFAYALAVLALKAYTIDGLRSGLRWLAGRPVVRLPPLATIDPAATCPLASSLDRFKGLHSGRPRRPTYLRRVV